jgi:hypothetical protein
MNVYHDTRYESEPSGFHPYDGAAYSPDVQYYDFKRSPELIPNVLEDFTPWANHAAVLTFYDLVRWVNSPDSALESSDCAFQGPHPETSERWEKPVVVSGRLMIIYRDLPLNTVRANLEMLSAAVLHYLAEIDPDFTVQQASVGTSVVQTIYTRLNRAGYRLQLSFWAWGDTDDEAFQNLDRLFKALRECLELMSSSIHPPTTA